MPEDIAVALNNLAYSLSEHDIVSDNDARIIREIVGSIGTDGKLVCFLTEK